MISGCIGLRYKGIPRYTSVFVHGGRIITENRPTNGACATRFQPGKNTSLMEWMLAWQIYDNLFIRIFGPKGELLLADCAVLLQ
jgi:hypothetical protein